MVNVLLIEDDSILQMILKEMLQTLNCSVDVAGTGHQALALLSHKHYSILFLDLGLPDIDGIALSKQIRKQGHTMPIIACSGRTESEAAQQCLDAKINCFLTKPVDIATLRSTLNKYLDNAA